MARFVDGGFRNNEAGQRLEVRDWGNQPAYTPSQTKVILLPYQQAAGWPELNQRFQQAPEISMILTPTASADQFIQAIGRGSRRNSKGPTDVQLVANDSCADRHRLGQLLKGLQFIAATGSPAVAPFLNLVADCFDRASAQRAVQDQRLIQLQKKSANEKREKIRREAIRHIAVSFRRSAITAKRLNRTAQAFRPGPGVWTFFKAAGRPGGTERS